MNRLMLAMGLILVLALSVPVLADPVLTITPSGKIEATVGWTGDSDWKAPDTTGVWAEGEAELDLALEVVLPDTPLSAYMGISAWAGSDDGLFGQDPFRFDEALELSVNEAWIQSLGAWWSGGPEVTTRVGRLGADFSDWVASDSSDSAQAHRNLRGDGLTVTDIYLWPVTMNVGYIWRYAAAADVTADETDRVLAATAAGSFEGVDFDLALAQHRNPDNTGVVQLATPVFDFAVGASSEVMDGIEVGGTYAIDGANTDSAFRLDASAEVGMASLSFLYRQAGDNFDPRYAKRTSTDAMTAHDRRSGFKLSAETEWEGVSLSGSFDSSSPQGDTTAVTTIEVAGETTLDRFDLSASVKMVDSATDEIKFGLGTDFEDIRFDYDLTIDAAQDMTHVLTAATDLPAPLLDTVNLAARVRLTADTDYAVRAQWSAPNGIDFEAGYNSLETIWGTAAADLRPADLYVQGGVTYEF